VSTSGVSPKLGDILNRLQGVRRSGDGWSAKCPAHDDAHNSLSITEDGDRLLVCCHVGCAAEAIVAAIGMSTRDLFEDKPTASGNSSKVIRQTAWAIKDADGHVVAQHIRLDYGSGSKSFVWRRNGSKGLGGLKTADLPLYGTDRLMRAGSESDVVIVEGEKACDALLRQGFVALGTVTGAAACPSEDSLAPLLGFTGRLFLWPDADGPGLKHMESVAGRLHAMGKSPLVVIWPQAPEHGDAADFTGDVAALLDAAQPWAPSPLPALQITHAYVCMNRTTPSHTQIGQKSDKKSDS